MADNDQYSGYTKEEKEKVVDPKNQAFSWSRGWSNLKSGLGFNENPQQVAIDRKKKALEVEQRQSEAGSAKAEEPPKPEKMKD